MNHFDNTNQFGKYPTLYNRPVPISLRIIKLFVMRSGTYNQLYYRPYQTHFDADAADALAYRLDSSNQSINVSAGLMSGIASQIMMPSHQYVGLVPIVNGWDCPRGRFMMVVEITMQTGTVFHYHMQGYTSHYDLTNTGKPDPNMVFYVNSYIRMARVERDTPTGRQYSDIVTESAQVINGRLVSSLLRDNIYGQRPHEIYSIMQGSQIAQGLAGGEYGNSLLDERHMFSDKAVISNRAHNLPANMISKIVNAYQVGQSMIEYGTDMHDVYSRSKEHVFEDPITSNGFFRQLANETGIPSTTSFTLEELQSIDPNVLHPSVSTFAVLDSMALTKLHHTGQTEYWHRPDDINAWVCTNLANSVPTIMMEMMLMKLQFTANNHDHMGVNHVVITGAKDILGRDIATNLNVFKERFIREIMYDLTHGNIEVYMLTMTVDLLGDTVIDIQYGSNPMTRYVIPSFCDSLMSPILSPNEGLVRNNAHDFQRILENLSPVTKPNNVINEIV